MKISQHKFIKNSFIKNSLLILVLFAVTLALNVQVISFNMMYFEQPLMYVVNQHAQTFKGLLHLYLHPQFLQFAVPFFRPSGHFLMYYLLVPLFGWHNTQALIIVNLLFLALSGWLMIKIYELLFPGYIVGGYIAFAIYLMHPATMVSRLSIMHFEYAYIFFSLASLYVFILFVKKNENKNSFAHITYLLSSILLFMFAATFKEPALMMGPVLFAYFCIMQDKKNLRTFFTNKKVIEILVLLTVSTLIIFFYVTSPWMAFFKDPARHDILFSNRIKALFELIKILLCFNTYSDTVSLRQVVNPEMTRIIMLCGAVFSIALLMPSFFKTLLIKQKHALVFLACAGLLFLILPVIWAMALAWHLNPTIVFFSMLFGFAFENMLNQFLNHISAKKIGAALALLIALITLLTNYENIHFVENKLGLSIKLNINAIFYPPLAKEKLHDDSIIVVEDSLLKNAYALGDSTYPFMIQYTLKHAKNHEEELLADFMNTENITYNTYRHIEELNLEKYGPTYNGSLFKYAYLMPKLREEEFPFEVEEMHLLPDEVLYTWLQNRNNIFCFGYDKQGHWHDKTALFKKNLLVEQMRRKISVHTYEEIAQQNWKTKPFKKLIPLVADPQLCEIECDKSKACKGFVMLPPNYKVYQKAQCLLYSNISEDRRACDICTIYVKNV